jgi:hypothetical protein
VAPGIAVKVAKMIQKNEIRNKINVNCGNFFFKPLNFKIIFTTIAKKTIKGTYI